MGKYMTPEDATLAGNFSDFEEDEEYTVEEPDYCCLCGYEIYDNYCDECEEYVD
jgi:hypothetical protein